MLDLSAIKNRTKKQILAELQKPLSQEVKDRQYFRQFNLPILSSPQGREIAKKGKAHALGISVFDLERFTFDLFKTDGLDEQNLSLFRTVRNWRINDENHGFFLFGGPGIGKTHLLTALFSSQWTEEHETRVINWPKLLGDLRGNWDQRSHYVYMALKASVPPSGGSTGSNTAGHQRKVKAVFIDEIGFADEKNWAQEFFLELINAIQSADIKCFGTSNLELDEFRKKFDSRIIDRLRKLGIFLGFNNVSYRKLAYQQNLDKFRDLMEEKDGRS